MLDNTQTTEIEKEAFYDLENLKNLYIVNNNLSSLVPDVISPNNSLLWLDLSNNSLTSLTNFNVQAFPSLTVLNVSYNALEYLPIDILDKLRSSNQFYLIIDDNPWNCSRSEWNANLSAELTQAFCTNLSLVEGQYATSAQKEVQGSNSTTQFTSNCSSGVFETQCAFWIFGAIWAGIILGNISKLKTMLFCPNNVIMEDKAIQCGKYVF